MCAARKVALVVGNGFTVDFLNGHTLHPPDLSSPTSLHIEIPGRPDLTPRSTFPAFFVEFDGRRRAQPGASDFEIIRQVFALGETHYAVVEARHFIVLAFRQLSVGLRGGPLVAWRWCNWLRAYSGWLHVAVSFNYETLLEEAMRAAGIQYTRRLNPPNFASGVVPILKPHGSCDFDIEGLVRGALPYPLQVHAAMSNGPHHVIEPDEWMNAPAEPLAVLPCEENPYVEYQWVRHCFHIYRELAPQFTHCIFAGLSYQSADRRELDFLLHSTGRHCHIIVANPTPPVDFINAVNGSGRALSIWRNGPEALPLIIPS